MFFDYRRRLLIIDGVPGSDQWKILFSTNFYVNREAEVFRALVNSVKPPNQALDVPTIALSTGNGAGELTLRWKFARDRTFEIQTSETLRPDSWRLIHEGTSQGEGRRVPLPASLLSRTFFRATSLPLTRE